MDKPAVSVVLTVLNEAKHIRDLLDSLVAQGVETEILVCDAGSTDRTVERVQALAAEHPEIRLIHAPGRRGATRNVRVRQAKGDYVAFIDGDCIANAFWLERLLEHASAETIVAGRTIQLGYWAFERLQRVELPHGGQDVTHPSCNLLYPREAFLGVGGFDDRFVTAEDIDLNLRSVEQGLRIHHDRRAIVYHRARDSIGGFVRQAYWNGYGRKQLTLKHGRLWSDYSLGRMLKTQFSFWGLVRLVSATFGYLVCKLRERPRHWARQEAP